MAVKRIPITYSKFEYQGITFALRPPVVDEVNEITKLLAAYSRSIRGNVKEDVADGIADAFASVGDVTLMTETQKYVTKTLVVDAETHEQQFADDADHDKINEIPADFLKAAWFCYTGQNEKPKTEDGGGDAPLSETPATTTSPSVAASSSLQSSSTAIPASSTSGAGDFS